MPRKKKQPPKNAVEKISRLASRGVRETDIAKALGTSYDTWKRWKTEHEHIQTALEEARQIEENQLFGVLFDKAMEGDSTCAMFLLKTRHGYLEGNQAMSGNAVQVNISIPGSMNPEDYLKEVTNE